MGLVTTKCDPTNTVLVVIRVMLHRMMTDPQDSRCTPHLWDSREKILLGFHLNILRQSNCMDGVP